MTGPATGGRPHPSQARAGGPPRIRPGIARMSTRRPGRRPVGRVAGPSIRSKAGRMNTPRARPGRTAGGYPARPPGQAMTQPGRATGQEIAQPGRATGRSPASRLGPDRRTSLRHSRRPATSSRTGRAGPSGATGAGSRRTRTPAVSRGEPASRHEDHVRGPRGAGDRGAVRRRGPAAPGGRGWCAADPRGRGAGQLGRVRVRRPRLGRADRRVARHRGRPGLRAGWLGPGHWSGAGRQRRPRARCWPP